MNIKLNKYTIIISDLMEFYKINKCTSIQGAPGLLKFTVLTLIFWSEHGWLVY